MVGEAFLLFLSLNHDDNELLGVGMVSFVLLTGLDVGSNT